MAQVGCGCEAGSPLSLCHPRVHFLVLSAQLERPSLEPCRLEARGESRLHTDEDLTPLGEAREPRGRIGGVAQRREVSGIAFPDTSDKSCTGVNSDADRDPWLTVVAGLLE